MKPHWIKADDSGKDKVRKLAVFNSPRPCYKRMRFQFDKAIRQRGAHLLDRPMSTSARIFLTLRCSLSRIQPVSYFQVSLRGAV